MEELEESSGDLDNQKKRIGDESKAEKERITQKNQEMTQLRSRIQELKKAREAEAASNACDGDLFRRYERFIQRKKTIALVPLEESGACGGCHFQLPLDTKNQVLKGRIMQCDSCSRFLYWKIKEKTPTEGEVTQGS